MNINKSKEESGKLVETIKMKYYYVWIILAIVITILAIIGIIDETADKSIMYKINYSYRRSIGSVMSVIVLIFKLMKDAKKKVYIYEKSIVIEGITINYKDINTIKFDVGSDMQRRYMKVELKNTGVHIFNIAHYNFQQMKLILEYIDKYSNCNIKFN